MSRAKQVTKSAGILVFAAIASKILGFVREQAIAYQFGASYLTDAYYVASVIPLMLFTSINGALRQTLIPIFVEYLHKKGRAEAFRFANNVFNVFTVLLLLMVIGGYLAAPSLVKLVAPGFSGKEYLLTVDLAKVLMVLILFLGLAGIASGILNALKDFTTPALTGLPQNFIIILAILALGETFGIYGLALGTIIGVGSQLFLQFPALKKQGMNWSFSFDLFHPGLKKTAYLTIPIFLGSSVNQLNVIVDRILASGLAEGSISALNFANRLSSLPLGLFTASIATVLFPTLAECASRDQLNKFKETMFGGLKVILFLTLPITVGLIILREPIIQLLFQRGAFDARDTWATAYALQFFALGIVAISLRELMNKIYFSLQDTTLPVLTGIFGLALNIGLNLILIKPLAHGGLALASSISAIANVAIMFIYLPRKIGQLHYCRQLGMFLTKTIMASIIMGIFIFLGNYYWTLQVSSLQAQLLKVGGLISMGATLYIIMAYVLKIEELRWIGQKLRDKFYYHKKYQVNYFPVEKEVPPVTPGIEVILSKVNEINLNKLPNFRDPAVINNFRNKLAEGHRGYFAIYKGEVIHHSWILVNTDLVPRDIDHLHVPPGWAYIHYCSTREDLRGKGVFTWVLTEILNQLQEENLNGIIIDAETKNQASLKAMAKAGFEPYALIKVKRIFGLKKRKLKLLASKPIHNPERGASHGEI